MQYLQKSDILIEDVANIIALETYDSNGIFNNEGGPSNALTRKSWHDKKVVSSRCPIPVKDTCLSSFQHNAELLI